MTADVHYLAYSAVMTWAMLLAASLIRARGWTPSGMWLAIGSRDAMPEPSVFAARADRAAKNMLESLVLFTAVVGAARLGGVPPEQIAPGAAVFFWARVVYAPVYYAGLPVVRTLVWFASIAGLVMILLASH
jgi:uncharacterized MAPEG superfamily protein